MLKYLLLTAPLTLLLAAPAQAQTIDELIQPAQTLEEMTERLHLDDAQKTHVDSVLWDAHIRYHKLWDTPYDDTNARLRELRAMRRRAHKSINSVLSARQEPLYQAYKREWEAKRKAALRAGRAPERHDHGHQHGHFQHAHPDAHEHDYE